MWIAGTWQVRVALTGCENPDASSYATAGSVCLFFAALQLGQLNSCPAAGVSIVANMLQTHMLNVAIVSNTSTIPKVLMLVSTLNI